MHEINRESKHLLTAAAGGGLTYW